MRRDVLTDRLIGVMSSLAVLAALAMLGCGAGSSSDSMGGTPTGVADRTTGAAGTSASGAAGTTSSGAVPSNPVQGTATGSAGTGAGAPPPAPGSFGSVGTGGGQDFAAFRAALDQHRIPTPSSIDAAGFFAEHYTSLPPPTCGKTFCLHGMLSVSPDLARGGQWTLLQMGMNSSVDPATVAKPPLDLVVVLDHSGSMAAAGKMEYARQGIDLLVDSLGDADTFTFIVFDNTVSTLFGPARVTDRAAIKRIVDGVQPAGSTDIYGGLEAGYKAALSVGDETQQRRVIFLTDGLPTAGITAASSIMTMSAGYNDKYIGLTTIGLGSDVDASLLRRLSEQGGGNFYFVEKPAAVQEVFKEELAFFVAPIAYDLELTFGELPAYKVKQVYGTNLWRAQPTGGQVRIPSVFLVSRTSTMPNADGGRRGGGSAIIAELAPTATPAVTGAVEVAQLHLTYRLPGSTTVETQDVPVGYDAGAVTSDGYYSSRDVEKNTIIMGLFIALRDATTLAQTDPAGAKAALERFRPRFAARIAGWADADLLHDLVIVQKFIDVLP